MKNKAQVYRCAETVARMLELKTATWSESKVEAKRVNPAQTIARRPGRARSAAALNPSLICSWLRGHTEIKEVASMQGEWVAHKQSQHFGHFISVIGQGSKLCSFLNGS